MSLLDPSIRRKVEFISPAELMQRKIDQAKRTVRFSGPANPTTDDKIGQKYTDWRMAPYWQLKREPERPATHMIQ